MKPGKLWIGASILLALISLRTLSMVIGGEGRAINHLIGGIPADVLMMIALALGLYIAIRKQWKAVPLCLVSGLIPWATCPPYNVFRDQAIPGEADVTVMTYNIAHGGPNVKTIVSDIDQQRPDILLIQEGGNVGLEPERDRPDDLTKPFRPKNEAFRPLTNYLRDYALVPYKYEVIAVKGRVIKHHTIDLPRTTSDKADASEKKLVVAEIELPSGIRIWSITAHLSPHRFGSVMNQGISIFKHCQDLADVRPKQLSKVNDLLKSLKGKNVIFGGDCNGLPQGIDYDRLREGYVDCFAEKGRGFGITGSSNRIDWLLSGGPDLELRSCYLGPRSGSDHRPIIAKFKSR